MATTKQLIDSALRSIGVIAAGEQAPAHEMNDALLTVKQMLDSWSNDSLAVFALVHEDFPLTGGRTFTIGPGADFDTVRPFAIEHMRIRDAGGREAMVRLASFNEWAGIALKDTVVTFPWRAYYEPNFPVGTLYFDTIPEPGNLLRMTNRKPLADLPGLTEDMEFPPGYERVIRLGLAMELAPEYGKEISQLAAMQFASAYQAIKRTNSRSRMLTLEVDSALTRSRSYDITHGPT